MNRKDDWMLVWSKNLVQLFERLLPHRYAPLWLVIFMDVVLLAFSAVLASVVLSWDFRWNGGFHIVEDYFCTAVVCTFSTLVFLWIFKVHRSVLRYSSFGDAIRLFGATLFGNLISALVVYAFFKISGMGQFYLRFIFVFFCFTYVSLLLFRMAVRWVFSMSKFGKASERKVIKNTVLFGAGRTGEGTANMLSKSASEYRVVAFFDDDRYLQSKTVGGLPVYSWDKREKILKRKSIDCLIFATHHITPARRDQVVEECLKNKIQILTVPPIRYWDNDRLSKKQIREVQIEDLLERSEIKIDESSIGAALRDKVIFISGGAGSIGSEIARQVVKFQLKKLVIFDQAETPLYDIENELKKKCSEERLAIEIGSVLDLNRLQKVFSLHKPDVVFHAAAYKHVPMMERAPYCALETNVLGTKQMADVSVAHGVKRFVMISTDKAVRPTNVMGASKRLAELYVQSLNNDLADKGNQKTTFVTTRFGNVLGSNGSVIPLFRKQIQEGGPVTVTHKNIERYFMTIPEACRLVLQAGVMGEGGQVLLFEMGKSVKIMHLAERMIQLSGMEPGKDIEIKEIGLRPGEKIKEELLVSSEETLPTYHEKVFIAQTNPEPYAKINSAIESIFETVEEKDEIELVRIMKELMPEFKSNHSRFEVLDK